MTSGLPGVRNIPSVCSPAGRADGLEYTHAKAQSHRCLIGTALAHRELSLTALVILKANLRALY